MTRETLSNPNAHEGFHTVNRLYMAAAFRILRAKQQAGGREGVAALLVDGNGSSRLFDGRRRVAGVRGIVPIYHDRTKAGVTLAEMLDQEFWSSGGGSVIDFASSDNARDIYHRSDRMFEGKIARYADDQRNNRNRNVWAVLSHLTNVPERHRRGDLAPDRPELTFTPGRCQWRISQALRPAINRL